MQHAPVNSNSALEPLLGKRLLFVDDEAIIAHAMRLALRNAGFGSITIAHDGDRALELHRARPFDLILTNYMMPRLSGIDLLRELRCQGDGVPVILHSGCDRREVEPRCTGLNLARFVQCPFEEEDYVRVAMNVLQAAYGDWGSAPPSADGRL
jgi:DNA-binding response OmpR family regulator